MQHHLITVSIFALILLVSIAPAESILNLNYQARLTSPITGDPVPDAVYPVEFRLYADSIGGTPVWFDNYDLPTNSGFFNAKLGGTAGLNLDDLAGPLYLEVLVNDELMMPRAPLSHVPFSAIARRVSGDIQTGAGFLSLFNSTNYADPAIKMMVDDISGIRSIKVFDPQPEPPGEDERTAIEMQADNLSGIRSIKIFDPQPEPPGDNPLVEINATDQGANIELAAPQAGGMSTDLVNPKFRAQVSSNGGRISLDDEASQYMGVEPSPFLPGGSLFMIDPAAGDTTIFLSSQGELIVDDNISNLESRLSPGNLMIRARPFGPTAYPPISMTANTLSAKIGIGTSTPSHNLHVIGNVRIVDGNEGAGKVLTSDNYGVATWQSPAMVAGEQVQKLLDVIEKQNQKISQLEDRITELERSSQ